MLRPQTGRYLRLILPILVGICSTTLVTGGILWGARAQSRPDKVGSEVLAALEAHGKARVMVALEAPPAFQSPNAAQPTIRSQVAALQADVLAGVDSQGYANQIRYQAVPALAGTILNPEGLAQLAAHPAVVKVDLDVGGRGSLAQSVPLIGADHWHQAGVSGQGVVVAVLDSGLDSDHDDLGDDLLHQQCFLDHDGLINGIGLCPNGSDRQSGPGAAEDDAGHGTHVTGIITSRGQKSSVGVAPDAQVVALKVLAGPSFAGQFFYFSEIVAALDYLINQRPDVKVINMSLGTYDIFPGNCDNTTAYNMAGASAINTLRANGVTAFASAGNNGSGLIMTSPACLSQVISVGATDLSDAVASFSNSNAQTDLMAPGVGILSAARGNGTGSQSGTSMATPHAAGCAALLLQSGLVSTPDELEARLESSPVEVTDPKNGLRFPRLDCTPQEIFQASLAGPVTATVGDPTSFTATVSPPGTTQPLTYRWETSEGTGITQTSGLSDTLNYTWTLAGSQGISLTVRNDFGGTSSHHPITIHDLPITGLSASNDSPTGFGNPTTLTATITGGTNATYSWDFGDGGTGSGAQVQRHFPFTGLFSATVTASNTANALTATTLVSITGTIETSYLPFIWID